MFNYLSIYAVAELVVVLAKELKMKKAPSFEELVELMSKRKPLPEIFTDGNIRIWVDKLYIAYSYEHLQKINYVYVTYSHIREEALSYIEASQGREQEINMPYDILDQFYNALMMMNQTDINYIIFEVDSKKLK